ncbi:Na+/H+ antiporter NhaC family protein [Anaerotruncus sp. 1XD42-93]|uniref:YfcC family protein n=1 Tax=Anaerotruncus sp. 1XD42-93 TaxID=2320853 RepID=UPI000EA01E82|nr:Na+/H+ antiporter NhaC family protein [Anaerotruncus sp. 1XD42-93]NBK18539.1 YfcC family protein [Anaerotruncus sp. 1XD42-93]NCE74929.1 YfcC family protein [Anaerotruncus sp. X29]RKJ87165.1 YfcC family protein [Anaerotruncus sp. 1XD22-93]
MEPKAKKAFKMPHTLVIIFVIILAAVVLTWLIPSGEYVRVEDAATGKKLIDPSSFHLVESTPVTPWAIMDYVVTGFSKSIDLILVILFAGGAFHMVTESGALQASVAKVARRFSSRLYIFIPILTLVFTAIGTSQGVNLFIPFVPITLMLSYALGLDSIVGVGIILLGGAIGFSTGTLQINTTLVAQEIAGLQPYSGIGYRFVCLVVFYVITNAYLIRYAMKIQKDPQLSPMYELDQQNEMKNNADLDSFGTMTWRRWAILAVVVGALGLIVYGGLNLDWEMANFAAMFLWLTVIVGLLDKKGPSAIAKGLVVGCKTMLGAALIIGLARAIAAVLSAGGIIDTIVYAMAGVLNVVPSFLQAPVMFLLNIVINCFITSGSGQAAVVMPLFLPVADLVGMTRQTAILAFNFGDGFCNYVLPTSTALMGLIGAANVPYDKWMKFMWKLFLIWCVTGCVLVSIAQFIRLA